MAQAHGTTELRRQAEKLLRRPEAEIPALSSEQICVLIHELEVHQIELEMQNEELRQIQQELEATRDRYAELKTYWRLRRRNRRIGMGGRLHPELILSKVSTTWRTPPQ